MGMTNQKKREKVIKGLKCHVHGHPHTRCHKCPYCGTGPHGCSECDVLIADALELLKAREPRVMTLEEVKLLKPDDDVWIEYHELTGWKVAAATVREIYDDGMLCRLQNLRYGFGRYGHYNGDYLAWRCWTQHPTDAQREETPWTVTSG